MRKKKDLRNQGDKIGGCIPDVKVDVDSVKLVQNFYIKHRLSSDVILGMPWVAKTSRVNDELMEKDNVIDKKKNRVINKLNKRKSIQTKGVNSKNVSMKSINQDDTFKFDINGGKAADGKTNDEQKEFVCRQNNNYGCCSDEVCDLGSDYKNQSVGLNDELLELSDLSNQKAKVSGVSRKVKRLVFEDSIKSISQSKCNGHGDTNARVRNIWRFESNKNIGENGNDSKKWDVPCVNENKGQRLKRDPRVFENIRKIGFFKRLYLDHMVGDDGLFSAVFGSHFEIRKLGRMDVTLETKLLGF
ncbi:hypothetical protein F8M41_011245 [Gigaspora margarita]|uniref:Uncharacterized protein n=1 Tax=Gigaspora margarita TaxID=4874 RepID=A0A8H3WZF3_GIGMA|nr:hypothetical protein F8M41_011245 [Gigaspora margarita]